MSRGRSATVCVRQDEIGGLLEAKKIAALAEVHYAQIAPHLYCGPIVGAALVVIVKNVVSAYVTRWNFMLGAIFVAIVVFMPEGLVPGAVRLARSALKSGARQKTAASLAVTKQ